MTIKPGWYTAQSKTTKQGPIVYLGIQCLDLEPRCDPKTKVDITKADYVRWWTSAINLENFLEHFTLTNRIVYKNGGHSLVPL